MSHSKDRNGEQPSPTSLGVVEGLKLGWSPIPDLITAVQIAILPTLRDLLCTPHLLSSTVGEVLVLPQRVLALPIGAVLRAGSLARCKRRDGQKGEVEGEVVELTGGKLTLSRVFMQHIWAGGFANGTDEGGRDVKEHLIRANARGVVLDLGAGHGHTIPYLARERVTTYVALEPNPLMHAAIRAKAHAAGYTEADGSLLILPNGAEDTAGILAALRASPKNIARADTIVSVLVLCTIPGAPAPAATLRGLANGVLAPGGALLFYEHCLADNRAVAWWQRLWAPLWEHAFDGCRLDRATHHAVRDIPLLPGSDVTQAADPLAESSTLGAEPFEVLPAAQAEQAFQGPPGLETTGPNSVQKVVLPENSVWREAWLWGKPQEPEENLFWHRVGKFVRK